MAKFSNSNLVHTINTESLIGNKTLLVSDPQMQFLNPNGSDRDVFLPEESNSEGIVYYISNIGSLNVLNIYEDSGMTLIGSISPQSVLLFFTDENNWFSTSATAGTGTDNRIARWNGTNSLQNSNWSISDSSLMSLNVSGIFGNPSGTYFEINNNSSDVFISLGHNGAGGIYSHIEGEEGDNYFIFDNSQKRWLINAEGGSETEIGDGILLTNGLIDATSRFRSGNGTLSSPSFSFISDSNNGMYLSGSDEISFSTNSTQRLLINNTGRIGINQNTANAYIDIAATGDGTELLYFRIDRAWFFKQEDSGSNAKLSLQAATSDKQFRINAEDGDPVFILQESSGIPDNNQIYLCPIEGRVGISTSSATPGTELDVNGIIASSSGSVSNPSYTFRTDLDTGIYNTTNHLLISSGANHVATFFHNTVSPFLGIGTTSPTEAIEIDYTSISDNCYIDINSNSSFQSGIRLRDNNITNWIIYQVSNTDLRFYNGSIDVANLTSEGNLELEDGTVSAPSFTFNADTNTGIYRIGSDRLGVSIGGTNMWDITVSGTVINNRLSVGGSGVNSRYINVDLFNATFTHLGGSGSPTIRWGSSGVVPTTFADQVATASATGNAYLEIPSSTEVVMTWTLPLIEDTEIRGLRMRYTKTGTNTVAPSVHLAIYAIDDTSAGSRDRVGFNTVSTTNVSNGTSLLTLGTLRIKVTEDNNMIVQFDCSSGTSSYEIYSIAVLYERILY